MNYYRKTYLCVCEGQQEELYLNRISSLLTNFPQKVVKFNTKIGNADRLHKSYEEYDLVAVFDYDFNEVGFKRNIEICEQLKKTSKPTKRKNGKRIFHAYSNVNFDLWLILHKEDYNRPVCNNDAYVTDVRRIYGLKATENIKCQNVIHRILEQITLEDVKSAIRRADVIRGGKIETDGNFIGTTVFYSNPDFSIHEFLKVVLLDCGVV